MTKDIRLNARIDADLRRKLQELSDTLGINQSAVLTIAINRMYQQEIKTMTTQTLTAEQMEAAVFAREVDTDIRYNGGTADQYIGTFYPDHPAAEQLALRARYDLGKSVLGNYSLRYTSPTTIPTINGKLSPAIANEVPADAAGTIVVSSGHTATSPAYRVAIFRPRTQQTTQTAEQPVYYIDEQMLGDTATEQDARKMVELLAKRGYNVEYGHALGQDETTIDDADWTACLDRITR